MSTATYQRRLATLRRMVERRLAVAVTPGSPRDLTEACRYVLSAGGKRIRSTLLLLSCEAVGGTARQAVDAGAAIEILHNFTLVHDDIMDNAVARRGRPTVHIRWNVNNALLTGDVLLGIAYSSLLRTRDSDIPRLCALFTQGLIEVCEGQALDLEFERRENVSARDYFTMIEKKTGRLIALAAEMGGLIGGGRPKDIGALRSFGHYLGRAFQLQDDLLDVIADQATFGKSIGGDIVERKKTYLLLTALEQATKEDRLYLETFMRKYPPGTDRTDPKARARTITDVTAIYHKYGVIDETRSLVDRNTRKALAALTALQHSGATEMLARLSEELVQRAS
jgi:geranylgeranyl diphosphate synthase type II